MEAVALVIVSKSQWLGNEDLGIVMREMLNKKELLILKNSTNGQPTATC